jgi:glycosyltransferase involved in cell wall biosynthesis
MDISIVITAYNKGPYIRECLLGVLNQDFTGEFEVILADDCSTDNTYEEVHALVEHRNFQKVNYVRHSKNKGLMGMGNFIWALNQAQGNYIALCDGDDIWSSKLKLTKQIEMLEYDKSLVAIGTRENIMDTRSAGTATEYGDHLIDYISSQVISKEDFFRRFQVPFHTSTLLFRNERNIITKLNSFCYVALSSDIVLNHILNSFGDVYFMNESLVTQSRNELGVTNNLDTNDLPFILNNYFLYIGCSKLYDNPVYIKLLLERVDFYKQLIIQKFKNRNIKAFHSIMWHYIKYGQFQILSLYCLIIYVKIINRIVKN